MITIRKTIQTESPQEQPILRVSTNYMETLQKVTPVSGGTEIKSYINDDKNLDLYTVGTDLKVFRLRQTKDQNAPYTVEDLGINASQLSFFQSLETSPDNPSILGINNSGELTLSTFHAGSYNQIKFQPPQASQKIIQFRAVRGATGNIYVNAVLDDNSIVNNFFSPSDLTWKSDRWVPMIDPDNNPAKVREVAMAANSQVQSSMFGIGLEDKYKDRVLFAEENFGFSKMKDLMAPLVSGKWGKVKHISVILDSANLLNIFAVEGDTGTLWVKTQKKYSSGTGIEFEDWKQVAEENQFKAKMNSVYAMMRYDNMLELFCIGDDSRLYHTRQIPDTKGKYTWTPLFPLGNELGNAVFSVTRNYNGYSELYSVTRDNEILRFWQSPETTQWFSNKIVKEEIKEEVISVPTHAIDLTMLDEKGVPQPKAQVTLSATSLTEVTVNGTAYQITAVDKITCTTDEMGKLTIYQRAGTLAAVSLLVETAFTQDPVLVEPNYQLQEKMQQITGTEVLNAKDKAGNYLLSENYRKPEFANSIASIMNESMSLAGTNNQPGKVLYFHKSRVHRLNGQQGLLKPQNATNNSWEIDFSTGFPIYKQITMQEATTYLSVTAPEGFLGIDWGEVWNGIKNGVTKLYEGLKKIVVTVGESIKAFFTIVIDGVSYVFESILDTIQQTFDFIEGVWNYLKVKAEQLFEWLGYLFNWKDIQRTAEAFTYSTNVFLDFIAAAIQHIRSGTENWIDGLKNDLKEAVDNYIKETGMSTTIENFGNEYKKPNPDAEHAMDHNPLFNAYKENYNATEVKSQFKLKVEESPLPDLVDQLQKLVENFQFNDGKEAFNEAIAYFSNIKDNPDKALELIFAGIIKVAESIALFAIDFGKGVILSILDIITYIIEAFKEIINEEWHIPIVSDIYKFITGKDLSIKPLDLLSYSIAIPSTIIYKIIKGEAPFPDDQSLQNFKDTFTLQYLKERAGLTVVSAKKVIDATQESVARTLFKAGYAVSLFIQTFADIATAVSSSLNTISTPIGYVSTGSGLLAVAFTNPWILDTDPGKLFCKSPQGADSGSAFKIGYIASALGPLKSAVLKVIKKYRPNMPDAEIIKIEEISNSIVGAAQIIVYVTEFVTSDKDPKVFARTLSLNIPGKTLRFLSLSELNESTYFIPVGILSVLTFAGYTSAYIINFTINEEEEFAGKTLELEY